MSSPIYLINGDHRRPKGASGGHKVSANRTAQAIEARLCKIRNTGITLEDDVRQLQGRRGTLITQLKLILIKTYFNHFVCV